MEDRSAFLWSSPVAEKVKLPATVVLKRMSASASDLLVFKDRGTFGPISLQTRACELEVGGQIIAEGRIVHRPGRAYLKITKTGSDIRQNKGETE